MRKQLPNPQQVNGDWASDMADIFSPTTEASLFLLFLGDRCTEIATGYGIEEDLADA